MIRKMKVRRRMVLSARAGSISENTLIFIKRANNSLIGIYMYTHIILYAYGLINGVEFSNRFIETVLCFSVFFSTRSRGLTDVVQFSHAYQYTIRIGPKIIVV